MCSNSIHLVLIALLMRRLCFLLLAFLFPLQLFAGTLESMANVAAATDEVIVTAFDTTSHGADVASERDDTDVGSAASAQANDNETGADIDPWQMQADLEDQTLPVPVATLPLDWQPFPHLYPHVNGGTSAFIDLLRPPPTA